MNNRFVLWSKNNYFKPLIIISTLLMLFGVTFIPLHTAMKDGAFILSFFFPTFAGWLLGMRLGLIFWSLFTSLLITLARANGTQLDEFITNGIPFFIVTFLVTSGMGRISDLSDTLKRELKERKQIEQKLHQYKESLERQVDERTKDLMQTNNRLSREIQLNKKNNEERIKAQKNATENEKLAFIGQIAGKLAHDFNNILGIIMGNAELSIAECKDGPVKKSLELIFEQTLRGQNLTKNLVAFAKDHEPKQAFFKISRKIDLVLNLMRKDLDGIEIEKEEHPGVPDLLADPGMIEHALVNLIQNSIHALSKIEHPKIFIRTYNCNNKICFEIEDNGCGIPEDHISNIFDPSFTLKGSNDLTDSYKSDLKGTGYGLFNVKKYINRHNGDIQVDSSFGVGTKFSISLPVIKKELTSSEKKLLSKSKTYSDKTILLVEDELAISDVQNRILSRPPCNHSVDIAHNGQAAIDLFNNYSYDFISLDYMLPGKINGMEIYHHVRKTDKTIPILFISGNLEFLESIKKMKQQDACVDHISKPCRNIDYLNSVNNLIKAHAN